MKTLPLLTVAFLFTMSASFQGGNEKKALNLEIKGMTCSGCVKIIEASLKKIDGVTGIQIDLEKALGLIEYDSKKVKEETVVEAIEKAGGKRHSFRAKKVTAAEGVEKKDLPDSCKPKGN
jgi:copper chaperone